MDDGKWATKYLNFLFIGMVGHEKKCVWERGELDVKIQGRQEVKDSASSSDLKGDCIGMLRKKA